MGHESQRAASITMKTPPDSQRATTSRPLGATPAQVMGGSRAQPLMTAPPSQPFARPRSQPLSQPLAAPSSQPQRLQLSGLIDSRIAWVATRERQRAWLVTTVVLAQALITVIVAPGYLIPSANLPMLVTLGAALLFYLIAFLFNHLRHELRVAVFMLIGGGALATAAQVFVTALLTHDGARTAQSALLFLPIILESGLFLAPELTLAVASAAAVLTASAILLALALSSDSTGQLSEAYLVMVYSLGLEVFIGYLAWRLAQFIYETARSMQADEDLRFAQARLAATQRQMMDQRRQLTQDVGSIQMAVSSALAHEYDTSIEVTEGDLAPLADSLNLLLKQLRSTNDLERKVRQMEAQAVPLIERVGRLANGAAPALNGETPTDTALYSLTVALNQAQALNARRQARLQEVAAEIANLLKHSREGRMNASQESSKAQQVAGQLVAFAATLAQTAKRQEDLLTQARRALALVLPPELTQSDPADAALREAPARSLQDTHDLQGLGPDIGIMQPGLTGEFSALDPIDGDAMIPPLTTPLRALSALPDEDTASAAATGASDLPAGLGDAWLLLTRLQSLITSETRDLASIVYDIGILGRHVRQTGLGLDWLDQALEAIERDAALLQQLASPSSASAELVDDASGLGALPSPMVSRPLDPEARMSGALGGAASVSQPISGGAPGSLRTADLIGFNGLDALGGQSGNLTGDDTDPH